MVLQAVHEIGHLGRASGEARRFVHERLREWGATVDLDVAVLLVSELVTNVVVHGRPPSSLALSWDGARLRVEVQDGDVDAAPAPAVPDPLDEGGRGLGIVEALAHRWGVIRGEAAKVVWFELGS